MVDNHAARTSEQSPEIKGKHGWISKVVIIGIFAAIIAVLVFAV